ncbi:MAG TPA: YIP1 family protein [Elusimicrobiota bacterium]|nr:YIP1 family protein [Elusimicrobiota bacterium]
MLKGPRQYFQSIPLSGGFLKPVLFAAGWYYISSAVDFVVARFRPPPQMVPLPLGVDPKMFRLAVDLGWLLVGAWFIVLVLFAAAGFFYVIWRLLGSKQNYEVSFRCIAYMAPLTVISSIMGIVPFLPIVAVFYGLYLVINASIETHQIKPVRAWVVWGLCASLFLLISLALGIANRVIARRNMGYPSPLSQVTQTSSEQDVQVLANQIQKQAEQQSAKPQ